MVPTEVAQWQRACFNTNGPQSVSHMLILTTDPKCLHLTLSNIQQERLLSWWWWHTPVMPALGRWRQGDHEGHSSIPELYRHYSICEEATPTISSFTASQDAMDP